MGVMKDNGFEGERSEPMRYGILGDDPSTVEDKLAKYSGSAKWSDLKKHLASGTLIYVDPALDLREVGKAFAEDRKDQVDAWLKGGDLVRPSQPHAAYWESIEARFECQVVSPFVLIQPAESEE